MEIGHDFNANPLWGLLTLFVACLGERETPRSAVDVRKAPASPNGHGPAGRLSVAPFSPSPPSLPQRAFTGEESKTRGTLVPKASGVYTVCLVYLLKLFVKFVLTGPPSPSGCTRMQGETP